MGAAKPTRSQGVRHPKHPKASRKKPSFPPELIISRSEAEIPTAPPSPARTLLRASSALTAWSHQTQQPAQLYSVVKSLTGGTCFFWGIVHSGGIAQPGGKVRNQGKALPLTQGLEEHKLPARSEKI